MTSSEQWNTAPVLALLSMEVVDGKVQISHRTSEVSGQSCADIWPSAADYLDESPDGAYLELNETTAPLLIDPHCWFARREPGDGGDVRGLLSGLAIVLQLSATPNLEHLALRAPDRDDVERLGPEVMALITGCRLALTERSTPPTGIFLLPPNLDHRARIEATRLLLPIPIVAVHPTEPSNLRTKVLDAGLVVPPGDLAMD